MHHATFIEREHSVSKVSRAHAHAAALLIAGSALTRMLECESGMRSYYSTKSYADLEDETTYFIQFGNEQ